MARQVIAAGFPFPVYVNETSTRQTIATGPVYVDETVSVSTTLPPGQSVYDLAPVGVFPIQQAQRSWTWSFNLNLIGKDALVPGKQVYDLAPGSPTGPPRANDLRTWTQSFNLSLVGKDIVPGKQFTDLPPRAYPEPATRTWSWQYNLNLIGKDARNPGAQVYDLPPRAYPEPATRTWTWNYNLNLIGQDIVPGKQFTELPPTGYIYPNSLRTWVLNLQQTTLYVVILQPIGAQSYDLPPRAYPEPATRTWTWSFNLNLIGKDALVPGKQFYDLAPGSPAGPQRASDLRTWSWQYNLNLIGKDARLAGQQYTDRPQLGPQQPDRTWLAPLSLPLNVTPTPSLFVDNLHFHITVGKLKSF